MQEIGFEYEAEAIHQDNEIQKERAMARSHCRLPFVAPLEDHDAPFQRVIITDDGVSVTDELVDVTLRIQKAFALRDTYLFSTSFDLQTDKYSDPCIQEESNLPQENYTFSLNEYGVFSVKCENGESISIHKSLEDYYRDLSELMAFTTWGPAKTVCYQRLKLLEAKFHLHQLLNENKEIEIQKMVPHRDFYNVRKIDTHIHHSSAMNQKHLLKFIKKKLRRNANDVVINRDGKDLTLQQVFDTLNLTAYNLNINTLDVHADKHTFHRFDKFNLKYNPFGQSRLREVFMKTDNLIKGVYLAELTKELCTLLEDSKYQYAEYRISIYGRSRDEWNKLSGWIIDNSIKSPNVRWLIQVPRLFDTFKANQNVQTFADVINNIFVPLFENTINPSSNPKLAKFLTQVVGFDCVDDESKPEKSFYEEFEPSSIWGSTTSKESGNPPYSYYLYYLWANLYVLNKLREKKNLNVFVLRPHSGEAGDIEHLATSFMLAHNISHGINLQKSTPLQYLYYLSQIGLSMSPLSNNSLFVKYHLNPFPKFFARGLNVSLSSDDPLQFHITKEPLIEEYSIAAQVWKLSPCDTCEIAKNSVMQSGFPSSCKVEWLGPNYKLFGPKGNDINFSNVPSIRVAYRHETLLYEFRWLLNILESSENDSTVMKQWIAYYENQNTEPTK